MPTLPPRPTFPELKKPAVPQIKFPRVPSLKVPLVGHQAKNPAFSTFLELLTSGTQEGEKLKAQLVARGRAELDRNRHLIEPLRQILVPLRTPRSQLTFRTNVVQRARARHITSQQAWDAVDELLHTEKNTVFSGTTRVVEFAERVFGKLTLTLGVGVEVGAGAGVERGWGIAGLRHHCVAFASSQTVAIGAYGELAGSLQAGVSGGTPEAGFGLVMDVSVNGAYGVSGEITVSLTPTFHRPTATGDKKGPPVAFQKLRDEESFDVDNPLAPNVFGGSVYQGVIVDYAFSGLAISVGIGAPAGGAAIGYTVSDTFLLAGDGVVAIELGALSR